jgi:hypothetical protein
MSEPTDGRHEAVAVVTPSQAFWRTVLQVGPLAVITLVGVAPEVIDVVLDGFGSHLPPEVYAYMAGLAVTLTALSATAARVMALSKVQDALKKLAPIFASKERTALKE